MKNILILICILMTGCSIVSDVKCKGDEIIIGMSEDELTAICGTPYVKNYSSNGSTQWVYGGFESLHVYIENGKVKSKQWSAYK